MTEAELLAEVARLEAENEVLARGLESLYRSAVASTTPSHALLDRLVTAAEHATGAAASGLYVPDAAEGDLVLTIVHGGGGEALRGLRIQVGQGLAGFCAATGQAIAIRDVVKDTRWHKDVARTTSYRPHTALCVPAIRRDELVAVLQFFDKDGNQPFTNRDLEVAGLFADLIGQATEESWILGDVAALFAVALAPDGGDPGEEARFLSRQQRSAEHRGYLELALELGALERVDPGMTRLCAEVVESIHRFVLGSGRVGASCD